MTFEVSAIAAGAAQTQTQSSDKQQPMEEATSAWQTKEMQLLGAEAAEAEAIEADAECGMQLMTTHSLKASDFSYSSLTFAGA